MQQSENNLFFITSATDCTEQGYTNNKIKTTVFQSIFVTYINIKFNLTDTNSYLVVKLGVCVLWYLTPLFNNIVAVSFIGGGNRSPQRKPVTCRKSLANFIT